MAAIKRSAAENAGFDALPAMNPEAFKEGYERMAKGVSSIIDFQKGTLEALMECSGACARGLEQAASEQTAFVKEAYEDGVSAVKAASGAKSVQEALEVQGEYARTAMEKNLGFASKLAEHWSGVAKDASDPVAKRYGEFVELVQSYRP